MYLDILVISQDKEWQHAYRFSCHFYQQDHKSVKLTEGENKGSEFTVLSATVELSQGKVTHAVRN